MARFRFPVLLLLLVVFGHSPFASGSVASHRGEVWVGHQLVLRVHHPEMGDKIAQRIEQAILEGVSASQISIRSVGHNYVVYGGKIAIITVSPAQARLNGTSSRLLAALWAKHLKEGLSKESYLVLPASLIVPVGEERRIHVVGRYHQDLSLTIDNPTVCRLTSTDMPLVVKGLRPGETKLQVSTGSVVESTRIIVKEKAGLLPKAISLSVTGERVPKEFLHRAVVSALYQRIRRKPGSSMTIEIPPNALPQSLSRGGSLSLPVSAEITGAHYLPAKGMLNVNIQNKPFTFSPSSHLMVSNNPESFAKPELLFREAFPDSSPVRLFFHHYNKGNAPYRLVVNLVNPSSHIAQIHIVQGVGGPDPHELAAGKSAVLRFFVASREHLGEVVEIGPNSSVHLASIRVDPREAISGVVELTPLTKATPVVETRVESLSGEKGSDVPAEEVGYKPKGVFPGPDIMIDAKYHVGGDYTFVTLGKESLLTDLDSGRVDLGNYGALYTIHFTIQNPTSSPAVVHIMFTPQAGCAHGLFVLNGYDLIQTPVVRPFTPYPLLKMTLEPGETRTLTLQTMPLGGSFYPVNLVVQP